jgi:uncharacterized protein (TIGR03382 family)
MSQSIRTLVATSVTVALMFGVRCPVAMADAVPPPLPLQCGAGTTLVHNHSGTRCVPDAPTNCPAGWLGIMGGNCIPNLCDTNDSCGAGLVCKPADLCATEAMGYRFGALESSRGPLMAAPAAPQWTIFYSEACSETKSCEGKAQCVAAKVCLPPGVARLAARPANAARAHRRGVQGAPLPLATGAATGTLNGPASSVPPASERPATPTTLTDAPPVVPPPSVPPPGRGSAGCSTSGASGELGGVLAALAWVLRRRKR